MKYDLNEEKIIKLLPRYLKLAEKRGRDIEIGFHPGYINESEKLIDGVKNGFTKFYFSHWRKIEHDTLLKLKIK